MTDADYPASILKIDWAQKHLVKLETVLNAHVESRPYTVTCAVEGKREVWRMRFTAQPDPAVALIVGDILHNARAALEYAAAELVKPPARADTYFPVFTEAVWDIPFTEEENKETTRNRDKWNDITKHMPIDAVTIIKDLQPIGSPPKRPELMPPLWALNNLANINRHRGLSVVLNGMRSNNLVFTFTFLDGRTEVFRPDPAVSTAGFKDSTEIRTPPGVVNVQVEGTPLILLRIREDWGNIVLPDHLRDIWQHAAEIVAILRPFAYQG